MTPLRVLVVDDEPLARIRLRKLLSSEEDVEIAGECANGREAVEHIRKDAPDLVCLDIQMPLMDGFGVIEEVGVDQMPVMIFVTAYDEHALRAFDVHALDYVLKPFDVERFRQALDRARRQIALRRSGDGDLSARLLKAVNDLRSRRDYSDRIAIKIGGTVTFLPVEEIDWIEATGNYVRFHTGAKTQLMRGSLSGLQDRLDPNRFVRIHRSTIVNIDRVRELQPAFHGDAVALLVDGSELPVSRRFRTNLPS